MYACPLGALNYCHELKKGKWPKHAPIQDNYLTEISEKEGFFSKSLE